MGDADHAASFLSLLKPPAQQPEARNSLQLKLTESGSNPPLGEEAGARVRVNLCVLRARGLRKMDLIGSADPYFVVRLLSGRSDSHADRPQLLSIEANTGNGKAAPDISGIDFSSSGGDGRLLHTSKVVRNSLTPEWDERFSFVTRQSSSSGKLHSGNDSDGEIAEGSDAATAGATLQLDVYDWDRLSSNDPMGRLLLPIHELPTMGVPDSGYS